jgi:hypothetical protein
MAFRGPPNQDCLGCHKRTQTVGTLLRRKGKGSVMSRINGAQGWSDAARVFPWRDTDLRHSSGADTLACARPAARVKAGRLAARAAGCLDARGSRRARIERGLVRVVPWDIGEPGEKGSSPEGTRRRSRLGRSGREVEPGRGMRVQWLVKNKAPQRGGQYSSARVMVSTRVVLPESVGSSEPPTIMES